MGIIIGLVEVMPTIAYELTQTVIQSRICNGTKYNKMLASDQYSFYKYYMHTVLNRYGLSYHCRPEFHAAPNFNLHFHSIILLPDDFLEIDRIDIMKRFESLGRIAFKKISCVANYLDYIKKDSEKMDNLFFETPDFELDLLYRTSELLI